MLDISPWRFETIVFLDESGTADLSLLWVVCVTLLSIAFGFVVSILGVLIPSWGF